MQDFREQYDQQISFLESSAKAYDKGNEPEAKRLAVSLRIFLHDSRNSTSLLQHLGVKDKLPFKDTAAAVPSPASSPDTVVWAFSGGLCMVKAGSDDLTFHPPVGGEEGKLDRSHPDACFEDWWIRPLLSDMSGNTFSRQDFVLAVANQDGGAHVDAKLNAAYQALTRENSLGLTQHGSDGRGNVGLGVSLGVPPDDGTPISNSLALASIRQMTYEVLESLKVVEWQEDGGAAVPRPICQHPFHSGVPAKLGRNDPCPCDNGKKLKQCFLAKEPRRQVEEVPSGAYSTSSLT